MLPYLNKYPKTFFFNENLRSTLLPRAAEESQAIVISGEGDLRALWEVEDVALDGLDAGAGLVLDVEVALDDDLHLVVGVLVHEWGAC